MASIADFVAALKDAFRDFTTPNVPASGPYMPAKAQIRSLADLLAALLQALQDQAQAGDDIKVGTWAQLAAIPPTRVGQYGLVSNDGGTHTDPVAGGTVANAGSYTGSLSPLGWRRTGDFAGLTTTQVSNVQTLITNLLGIDNLIPSAVGEAGVVSLDTVLSILATQDGIEVPGAHLRALLGGMLAARNGEGLEGLLVEEDGFLRLAGARLGTVLDAQLSSCNGDMIETLGQGVDGQPVWANMPKNRLTDPPRAVGFHAGGLRPDGFSVAGFIEGAGVGAYRVMIYSDAALSTVVQAGGVKWPKVRPASETPVGWSGIRYLNDSITGLAANTTYYVVLEVEGVPQPVCKWKTAPTAGSATAFRYGISSCMNPRSLDGASILRAACNEGFLFFAMIGDNNYDEPIADIASKWLAEYATLSNPDFQALARVCPIVWAKDDHDYGMNNSSLDDVYPDGRPAYVHFQEVIKVAREINARYPYVQEVLGETDVTKLCMATIFQIAQTLFHIMDSRRFREHTPPNKTCIGDGTNGSWDHVEAFFGNASPLATSAAAGIKRNILISPTTWGPLNDAWGDSFPEEKAVISNKMRDMTGAAPIMLPCGDQHRFTGDWSANSDGATGGGLSLPVIGCSPIHDHPRPVPGAQSWFGTNGDCGSTVTNGYVAFDAITTGEFTAKVRALPLIGPENPNTVAATDYRTFSSTNTGSGPAVQTVGFTLASEPGASSAVAVNRSIPHLVGTTSVDWSATNGASGTLTLRPNKWKYTLPGTFGVGVTITLSNPVNCTLGQATHTRT